MRIVNIISTIFSAAVLLCSAHASAQETSNFLTCEGAKVSQDAHKDILIGLTNSISFTAFQCDITIPNTVKFIEKDGKFISPSSRFTQSHKIVEKKIADNKIRVLAYSTTNSEFSGASGEPLFAFTLGTELDQAEKLSTTINNIFFSHADEAAPQYTEHRFEDLSFTTEVTGINNATADNITIYAQGKNIIIISSAATSLQLTTAAGITHTLDIKSGKNIFPVDNEGVYIVGTTKVIIK